MSDTVSHYLYCFHFVIYPIVRFMIKTKSHRCLFSTSFSWNYFLVSACRLKGQPLDRVLGPIRPGSVFTFEDVY